MYIYIYTKYIYIYTLYYFSFLYILDTIFSFFLTATAAANVAPATAAMHAFVWLLKQVHKMFSSGRDLKRCQSIKSVDKSFYQVHI